MVNESENILDDMTSETQSDLESVIDDSLAKDDQVVDMAQLLEELQSRMIRIWTWLKELRRS